MGLLSTNKHFHSHDNSVSINFPDTIKIEEHKAPTDDSIKIMEEMHDKAIKNIIAKVKVEDNLVSGVCYVINQPYNLNDIKLIFKFKINGQEFTIEKEVDRSSFTWEESKEVRDFSLQFEEAAKGMILWYALKKFTQVAYEQITQSKLPDYFIK